MPNVKLKSLDKKLLNKNEILHFLKAHKQELYEKFGVIKIGLFGSFSNDKNDEFSDIDIVVTIENNRKNLHNFLALKRFLEKNLNREVDLGLDSALKPYIKDKILKETVYV